jgi:hypothetical protein
MPQVRVSRHDLENLARKLDELAPSLNDQERAALLAVFGMASQRFESVMAEQGDSGITGDAQMEVDLPNQGTLPPLSTSFMSAFSPGDPAAFSTEATEVTGTVGIKWTF